MDAVQSFMTPDSLFHFMLVYPELNFQFNEWVQATNPVETQGEVRTTVSNINYAKKIIQI